MSEKESPNYNIKTYGCKVNTYDSGLLQKRLEEKSFAQGIDRKVHILNTCAVTAEATKEALRHIRRLKRKDKDAMVVVTGCAAQVDTKEFEKELGADLIVANSHKGKLEDYILDHMQGKEVARVQRSDIFEKTDLEEQGGLEEGRSRAFLKIQDGCNSFCTYCVIPFARGKSRSVPIPKLIEKVNELYDRGFREAIVTGIHIGDYASTKSPEDHLEVVSARGRKNPDRYYFLEDLMEALLKYTKMPRFRLGSLEPQELTPRLLDLYSNPRMCPHFHMSIQSACSKTLKDMKRKYDAILVERSLTAIYEKLPHAFVGMDLIVGFPGETEEDFNETFERLEKLPWTRIHVFPYSDRPGTKAENLDNKVYDHVKAERAKKVRALSTERYSEQALKQIGSLKDSLLLTKYKKGTQALARDYWQIQIINDKDFDLSDTTEERQVKILGFDNSQLSRMDGLLTGELV
jgi:threonylcarbamoyladenosine tRNA methylthiotransferase MtaB